MKEPPLLVIYDGHLTHVLLKLIEKAIKVKITIVKLSPHVTDRLQPLDACCFGQLPVALVALAHESSWTKEKKF